jgi:ankyrin repeat protein
MFGLKKILLPVGLMIVTSGAMAENIGSCKHNALHFAVSVERQHYVEALLQRDEFTLDELNKQCETVFHIATELGNINLLRILGEHYRGLGMENLAGENLLQSAIKYKQPEVLLFLIRSGLDPSKVSANGKTAMAYQQEFGNTLSGAILNQHNVIKQMEQLRKDLEESKSMIKTYYADHDQKDALIKGLSDKLSSQNCALDCADKVKQLTNNLTLLEGIIAKQDTVINNMRTSAALSDAANSQSRDVSTLQTHEELEGFELPQLSAEGDVGVTLLEVMTKPIIKKTIQ